MDLGWGHVVRRGEVKSVRKAIVAGSCGGLALAILGMNQVAAAHIRLTAPTSRHPIPANEDNSFLKDGPCGGLGDSRTIDPARISTFAPGEVITIEWHETIHHASHYRIAFDADGQDDFVNPMGEDDIVEPPVLPILLDGIPDKSNGEDSFSVQVTLPTTPCDNCTIQLMQYMYDRDDPFYYQCADIVIAGDPFEPPTGSGGTTGTGGTSSGTGGALSASTGGGSDQGVPPSSGGTGFEQPGEATGGSLNQGEPGGLDSESAEAAGCTVGRRGGPLRNRAAGILFALSAAVVLRRRSRAGSLR